MPFVKCSAFFYTIVKKHIRLMKKQDMACWTQRNGKRPETLAGRQNGLKTVHTGSLRREQTGTEKTGLTDGTRFDN